MTTRSIVGRFLILAIFIVAVGIVTQAALILTASGKKVVKTASAAPLSTSKPADEADAPAGDPVRVVYPGPLGDTTAQRPKLADAATASPLAPAAPQVTARLAQAMTGSTPAAAPQAPAPSPASVPAAAPPAETPAVASALPDAVPQPAPPSDPAPAQTAVAPQTPPAAPAPAGIQVASLGGGAPASDQAPAGGVNINTASVDALNRLGGGHIGESIAKHRPYRSVEDLVKKRVLRRSVFAQIRNQIDAK